MKFTEIIELAHKKWEEGHSAYVCDAIQTTFWDKCTSGVKLDVNYLRQLICIFDYISSIIHSAPSVEVYLFGKHRAECSAQELNHVFEYRKSVLWPSLKAYAKFMDETKS